MELSSKSWRFTCGFFGNDTSAATQHYALYHGYSESRSTDSFDATSYLASHGDLLGGFWK